MGDSKRLCNFWFVAAIFFAIAIAGIVAVTALYLVPGCSKLQRYGLIIDAGSSKSGLMVYRWKGEKLRGTGELVQIMEKISPPGISSFIKDPAKAGESLLPLLAEAEAKVPDDIYGVTPVYLGTTAGMRVLEGKDPKVAEAVLKSVKDTLANSKFKYHPDNVKKISEEDEGMFAWLTPNLILGNLGNAGEPRDTTGTLDLGGASTQIAFQTTKEVSGSPNYAKQRLYGNDFNVFSRSFLCYGQDQIILRHFAQVVLNNLGNSPYPDPCYHVGRDITMKATEVFDQLCTVPIPSTGGITNTTSIEFKGTGNPAECKKIVQQLLNTTECNKSNYTSCFDNSLVPETNGKFLAITGFFYVTKFMQALKSTYDHYNTLAETFCKMSWSDVQKMKDFSKYTQMYCFISLYTLEMLGEEYGFKDRWQNITFSEKVKDVSLGWALGMLTKETNSIPSENSDAISKDVFIGLIAVFAVTLVVVIIFTCRAFYRRNN